MDTYILLCDRADRQKGASAPNLRLLVGLIGTVAAAILSFSGPRASIAAPQHQIFQIERAAA